MDTDADKIATARKMIDAWNRLDWDLVIDLFAEDGSLHSMMEEKATVGRDEIGRRIRKLAEGATEVDIEVRTIGVIGGAVFTERVDRFVNNGNHGEVPVVGVLEIADGRVTSWREYYDRATLLSGLGVERDFAHDL
ncbi:MAG: limonene-1,2-epoxide hydrolase family protein [Kibdelosporangium sp.]